MQIKQQRIKLNGNSGKDELEVHLCVLCMQRAWAGSFVGLWMSLGLLRMTVRARPPARRCEGKAYICMDFEIIIKKLAMEKSNQLQPRTVLWEERVGGTCLRESASSSVHEGIPSTLSYTRCNGVVCKQEPHYFSVAWVCLFVCLFQYDPSESRTLSLSLPCTHLFLKLPLMDLCQPFHECDWYLHRCLPVVFCLQIGGGHFYTPSETLSAGSPLGTF